MKVLLVDDAEGMRKIITSMLKNMGHDDVVPAAPSRGRQNHGFPRLQARVCRSGRPRDADDGVALPKVDAAVGTNHTSALGRIGSEIDVCVRAIYRV